jgi:hypothetical protein
MSTFAWHRGVALPVKVRLLERYMARELGQSHHHTGDMRLSVNKQYGKLGQLEEWDASLGDFQRAKDRTAVPAEEQAELKAVVNSTRSDMVVASGAAVA